VHGGPERGEALGQPHARTHRPARPDRCRCDAVQPHVVEAAQELQGRAMAEKDAHVAILQHAAKYLRLGSVIAPKTTGLHDSGA